MVKLLLIHLWRVFHMWDTREKLNIARRPASVSLDQSSRSKYVSGRAWRAGRFQASPTQFL